MNPNHPIAARNAPYRVVPSQSSKNGAVTNEVPAATTDDKRLVAIVRIDRRERDTIGSPPHPGFINVRPDDAGIDESRRNLGDQSGWGLGHATTDPAPTAGPGPNGYSLQKSRVASDPDVILDGHRCMIRRLP